ncbi:MAG TPA: complex I NDUFA9 subunit family protein [Paracoccaceae bacterium]|nr:complex I NDUFA9 subunit family protein [Paracoccaceae bacterium]
MIWAPSFSKGLVTVVGGSGFVGRYIAQRMARRGWRVRVACRRPNEALFVQTYGVVGQVLPVQCNIRDEASMRSVLMGADAVVNCVGVLWEGGRNRFDAVHVEGAARVARLAAEQGARRLVHISAIGADPESPSRYGRTKAEGERAVLDAYPNAVILRPSVVFGPEDALFNRFASMTRFTPVLPVVGAETRFQPVWVEDVAEAAAKGATGEAEPGLYELGGPRVATFREMMQLMLQVIRRRRAIIEIPFGLAGLQAWLLQLTSMVGVKPMLTVDQVEMLRRDNVVAEGVRGFHALGLQPTAMEAVLDSYLYAYRKHGQYSHLAAPDATGGRLHGGAAGEPR